MSATYTNADLAAETATALADPGIEALAVSLRQEYDGKAPLGAATSVAAELAARLGIDVTAAMNAGLVAAGFGE